MGRSSQIDALVDRWYGRKPRTPKASDLLYEATGHRVRVATR